MQELLLGKFMDARSKDESTEAGKMMSYIGYAEEYMSKKRNTLYPSITRLMNVSSITRFIMYTTQMETFTN